MQPYFFPWIGYFQLIANVDEFIIFDTVQFKKHNFMQRNRILSPHNGWQYIQAPIQKCKRETNICDIRIRNEEPWREKILSQLVHYNGSPFYRKTIEMVKDALDIDTDSLTMVDKHIMEVACRRLGVETPISVFSEMKLDVRDVNAPDEWALRICQAIEGADEYWNPPGGVDFFERAKYELAGVKLKFLFTNLSRYDQRRGDSFEEGLSIIDVMMFNPIDEITDMLNEYTLK